MESKILRYGKLKGAAGISGTDYQLKLLQYFLLHGFHNESEFKLSTENIKAGNFDDIVFETKEKTILLQAKHTNKNISFEHIFPPNSIKGDFNLFKYLKEFPKIVKNFDIEQIRVIICTTNTFNEEKIRSSLNKETKTDESNNLKKQSCDLISTGINNVECYSFDSNQDILVKYISKNVADFKLYSKDDIKMLLTKVNKLIPEEDIKLFSHAVIKSFSENTFISENIYELFTENDIEIFTEIVVKLFLDKLLLVTVSDRDLDDGIKKLIKLIDFTKKVNFELIQATIFNKIRTWFQSEKGRYLTKKNAVAFISEIISLNYLHGKIHSCFLLNDEYNNTSPTDDYPVMLNNNLILLKIQSRESYDLHEIKIHQFLLNNLLFSNKEVNILHKLLLVDPNASENVTTSIIESFKIPEYIYLILPIFGIKKIDITKFVEVVEDYKRIIFVTDTAEVEDEINNVFPTIKKFVVNIKFSDFSEITQNEILRREIKFQGNKMTLQDLIGAKNVNLDDFIDEVTLLKLIINKDEIVVNDYVGTNNDIPFYIRRSFRPIKEKFMEYTFYQYSDDENQQSEEGFCLKILEQCDNKFIVIFDSPGMGKSTVLNKLHHLLRREPYWIKKINLNDCTKVLWKLHKEKRELISLDEFLNLVEFSKSTQFESKIFNISENVVLLLDAIDEVTPEFTDLILNSLAAIAKNNNVRKIVITSRTHVYKHFEEKHIECQNFALVPFFRKESIELLVRFWENEENDENKIEKIENFSKNLIDELNKKVDWKKIKTLIGIPLQTKMIGQIFTKHCKDFLENSENPLTLPENLNLYWLYNEFIERKKEIYVNEKCNADGKVNAMEAVENQFEDAINEHIKAALKLEFPQHSFKILNAPRKSEEKIFLKMGILIKSGDHIQFVHRTLSEFFATRHICELILKNELSEKFLKHLIRSDFFCENMFFKYMLENKALPNEFKIQFFNLIKHNVYIEYMIQKQPEVILFLLTKFGYKKLFQTNCAEALHRAVGYTHTKLLLEKLEEIQNFNNFMDKYSKTPLHYAFEYNSEKVVKFLLNKGHLIVVCDHNWTTLLHDAARWGKTSTVELLLDKGHPIDISDTFGTTPLHCAAWSDKPRIIELLLEKGHPIAIRDKKGKTPLHNAVWNDEKSIIELLLDKGHPIDVRENDGTTPLHYAALKGNMIMLNLLLDKGHPVDVSDNNGTTPLHIAILEGTTEATKVLVDRGHPVNVRDKDGTTPLHTAIWRGVTDIIELLLNKGHPVDVRDENGTTPLHIAVWTDKMSIVELLIDRGHPVDVREDDGSTPLHYAALDEGDKTDIFELLLGKGHPIDVPDKSGSTLLHIATQNGRSSIAAFLLDEGHPVFVLDKNEITPLHNAALSDITYIIELLLDKGHPIDIRDKNGKTPLHYAVTSNNMKTVQFLLDKGHPINVCDKNGITPLHTAVSRGETGIIELLIAKGHPVNIREKNGTTLLEYATRIGRKNIVDLLINKGHVIGDGEIENKRKKWRSIIDRFLALKSKRRNLNEKPKENT